MNRHTPANPAGLIYFDRITGINICSRLYSENTNVFAAIPSLHAAYSLLTVLHASSTKNVWLRIALVFFMVGIWFSAVYSRHHYVIDVLMGGVCTLCAYVFYRLLNHIPAIKRVLIAYSKVI